MQLAAIGRLFGRSPFAPLQAHMEKVALCINKLNDIFDALKKGQHDKVAVLAKEISKLEHEADLTKDDIRTHLPKGMFMPVDRGSLLEILALQDSLADTAEDVAVLLTYRDIALIPGTEVHFDKFLAANIKAFEGAHKVVLELTDLLESSFGGVEADKVRQMVRAIAKKEHEVDLMQRELLRELFRHDEVPAPTFVLWMKILETIAAISNTAEKLGNRIRMTLEMK